MTAATPARTLRGLYAITSAAMCLDNSRLLASCEAALHGGARLLQYRDKHNPLAIQRRLVTVLVGLCHHFNTPLIVNDDIELARAVGADGVHLGTADRPVAEARARLGANAIIGATCADSLERARAAIAAGATYVAFGRFFPSHTKPDAPPAPLELLTAARRELGVPICAIGGIKPDNGAPLIAAGADLLAAVEGVFEQTDATHVAAAARRYAALFAR